MSRLFSWLYHYIWLRHNRRDCPTCSTHEWHDFAERNEQTWIARACQGCGQQSCQMGFLVYYAVDHELTHGRRSEQEIYDYYVGRLPAPLMNDLVEYIERRRANLDGRLFP